MNSNLPGDSIANGTRFGIERALRQRWRHLVPSLLGTGFVLVLAQILIPSGHGAATALTAAALTLAPLAALLASISAFRTSGRDVRLVWLAFAIGAAIGVFGQLSWFVERTVVGAAAGSPLESNLPFLLFHLLFAAGAALALRPARTREVADELALDVAIVVLVAVILLMRFALDPFFAPGNISIPALLGRLAGPLAALGALFFAGLLLVWHEATLGARSVIGVVASSLTFTVGSLLVSLAPGFAANRTSIVLELIWLTGWAFLAAAAMVGATDAVAPRVGRIPRRLANRLRRAIVPFAVAALTLLGVDLVLHSISSRFTAIGVGLLGALLVLRTHQALKSAAQQAEENKRLAHTRALVEVSRALAGATEVDRALNLVAQWACRLLDAHAAAIELVHEENRELELLAAAGLPASAIGMRFSLDNSFTGWVVLHGRERVTDDATRDPLMQPQSAALLGNASTAAVPLRYREHTLGVLSCIRDLPFDDADTELLRALADQAATAIETARLFEQVHSLSLTDPLTGLANRRQLERDMSRELAAARRGRKVAIVLFDLDDFKPYNDHYGHLAGDEALRVFGSILGTETRAMNLAARYGGDEFVVLLSESDCLGAQRFADRVGDRFRQEVELLGFGTLSVSYGVTEFMQEMETADDFFAAADRALYDSKAGKPSR